MSVKQEMTQKLQDELAPLVLRLDDVSEQHAGHSGWRPGGETHFDLVIKAAAFDGLTRVQRQRLVYQALKPWLAEQVHALSIKSYDSSQAVE